MKRLLIMTCGSILLIPATLFAFGENENTQIQFAIGVIQGYNFTPAINDIPKYNAEKETARLNAYSADYFNQEDEPANYTYGVSFEPRLFFYYIGLGCNVSLQWSSESESTVSTTASSNEVRYSAQLFTWSFTPTVYFRPFWTKDNYFIIGAGIGYYGATIITGTNVSLTSGYQPQNSYIIDDSYEARTTGYHFVIEYGQIINILLVNIGVAFDYTDPSEFENDNGAVLFNWRDNETYKTSVLSFYFYIGFGLKI